MDFTFYDTEKSNDANIRWVQPPLPIYFLTTCDAQGNANCTPVTIGTLASPEMNGGLYYCFSLSRTDSLDGNGKRQWGERRHAVDNLEAIPECVISYAGRGLFNESWIAALPIPRGISEIDVAGMTPLKSRKVRPCGVLECAVNMEARVVSSHDLPGSDWVLYLCRVVGVTVRSEFVKRDKELLDEDGDFGELGMFAIDPLFEVSVKKGDRGSAAHSDKRALRMYCCRLDPKTVERHPDEIGCIDEWIGSFDSWMMDEQRKGRITEKERQEIMRLNGDFQSNRDPVKNRDVKDELTRRLRRIVGK